MASWAFQATGLYANGSGGFHNSFINDADLRLRRHDGDDPRELGIGRSTGTWAARHAPRYDGTTQGRRDQRIGRRRRRAPTPAARKPLTPLDLQPDHGRRRDQFHDLSVQRRNDHLGGLHAGLAGHCRRPPNFSNLSTRRPPTTAAPAKVIVLMTDGVDGLADNGNSNARARRAPISPTTPPMAISAASAWHGQRDLAMAPSTLRPRRRPI